MGKKPVHDKTETHELDPDSLNIKKSDAVEENSIQQQEVFMEDDQSQVNPDSQKALKLAKLSLLITVLGIGILTYLHFDSKEAISSISTGTFKTTLKNEISGSIQEVVIAAQQPQIQSLMDKNAELEIKMTELKMQIDKIAELEMKMSQFEVELQKNANLRAKVAELQSKTSKVKAAPAKAAKTSKAKPARKGDKKKK